MSRRRLALTGLLALAALAGSIAIGSSIISAPPTIERDKGTTTDAKPAPGTTTPAPDTEPAPEVAAPALRAGYLNFNDQQAGFSIAYPRGWRRLTPSDKAVRLLVADGAKDRSLLVRVAPVGLTVTRDTLGIVRDLTDRLVGADRRVKLLSQPQPLTLAGLPGYRYLYTFSGRNGRRGAHVHYFLFRGKRLFSIVLQVPGASALKRDSVLLGRVAGTFRAQ